jgi:hypothetical protein
VCVRAFTTPLPVQAQVEVTRRGGRRRRRRPHRGPGCWRLAGRAGLPALPGSLLARRPDGMDWRVHCCRAVLRDRNRCTAERWRHRRVRADASRGKNFVSTLKCGEPHDRLQDATNLQAVAQSKPSKPGGTARAERAQTLAGPSRRAGLPQKRSVREWTRDGDVGGGADFGKPQERRPVEPGVAAQPALGPCGLAGSESVAKESSGRTVPVASPKERQRS